MIPGAETIVLAASLGGLAALAWGASDFFARFAGAGQGIFRALYVGQILGVIIVGAALALTGDPVDLVAATPPIAIASALLAAILGLAATATLYRAVTLGMLSVVAPLIAAYGAITALLSYASGEPLTPPALGALALVVVGALLVSRPSAHASDAEVRRTGAWWALASAAAFGLQFFIQGRFATHSLGPLLPVFAYHFVSLAVLTALIPVMRPNLTMPPSRQVPAIVLAALTAIGGYLALAAGFSAGSVAVATVFSSLQSGVTVVLASVFLRESLSRHQLIGVIIILCGTTVLNTR